MREIQWFPGHMTKTLRLIEREISGVDMVIEITDARLPDFSRSPEIYEMTSHKPRLIVMNKSDLADAQATKRWLSDYARRGIKAIAINSTEPRAGEAARAAIMQVANAREGRQSALKPRAMIVGVPNCGKSTFINCLAGSRVAKAEDRPGVTRGKQWISLDFIELLDMPGVLRKKFDNQLLAARLAFTGAIKDDVMDVESLAIGLIDILKLGYPQQLFNRYGVLAEGDSYDILCEIARKRGKLLRGAEPDTERTAALLLDEYRAGKLGKITLEEPQNG